LFVVVTSAAPLVRVISQSRVHASFAQEFESNS